MHYHASARVLATIQDCQHQHKTHAAAEKCRQEIGGGFVRECSCVRTRKPGRSEDTLIVVKPKES